MLKTQIAKEPENPISNKILELIDALKSVCANHGLGNDAGEYKIITQAFLYKFLNDKFLYEIKQAQRALAKLDTKEICKALEDMDEDDYQMLCEDIGANVIFQPSDLIPTLFESQNTQGFHKMLDGTLENIASNNVEIFSIITEGGSKIKLFEPITQLITDQSKRDGFAKAIISRLTDFDFESVFSSGYDFFAHIFEYLIKDYNKDNGGKYAEYYTPYSVSSIMARILVGDSSPKSVSIYDPSAGSGTLLMSLAHTIGQDKCTIYAQDISQKSSQLLRLNLILNNLSHSIHNITQGNTLTHPSHTDKRFDFIVSNPPFKLDFSEYRAQLDAQKQRFFAGVPKIPNKKLESMAIYLCFFQHLLNSLSPKGRAAIVVPTGFITATSGIEKTLRQALVDSSSLLGCITMPPNIFATTGTNVSVIFIDRSTPHTHALLMDASKLGSKQKTEKNERTILSQDDEDKIISTFLSQEEVKDFSVLVPLESIAEKGYSFSAGQYFDFSIEHIDLSQEEFDAQLESSKARLQELFAESSRLQGEIVASFERLKFKG